VTLLGIRNVCMTTGLR